GASGATPTKLTVSNNLLFFSAQTTTNGRELWRTDGTFFGTFALGDLNPGAVSSLPAQLTDAGGQLFFTANDGTHGVELWRSGGPGARPTVVVRLTHGRSSNPAALTNANGVLYFIRPYNGKYQELWKSDGTAAGTILVKDTYTSGGEMFPIGADKG